MLELFQTSNNIQRDVGTFKGKRQVTFLFDIGGDTQYPWPVYIKHKITLMALAAVSISARRKGEHISD